MVSRKAVSEAAAAPPEPLLRRARGRPARLSRQAVLDAALVLLADSSIDGLTLARVGQALGTSAMSLYTYFPNRDALLEALAEHAFGQLQFAPRGPDWRANLLAWLSKVQEHIYRHPAVAKTMGWDGRVPAAWLRVSVPVIDELVALGLRGEALVFALNWFMSSAIGLMLVEANAHHYRQQLDLGMLATLPPAAQETLLTLRREWHIVDRASLLDFGFSNLLEGLQKLAAPAR